MHDVVISLDIIDAGAIGLSLDEGEAVGFELSDPYIDGGVAEYEGEYQVTPSDEMQVLPTAYLKMAHDVIVNPIPSNYGRVEWNGVALTVS